MKSTLSSPTVTYTARGLARYEVEVRHDGLSRYQVVRGDDEYVVQQKALAKAAQWDEMYSRKVTQEQKRREREANMASAAEMTAEAESALTQIGQLLADTLSVDDTVDWNVLKNTDPFPVQMPMEPTKPKAPPQPVLPGEPTQDLYVPSLTILDNLFSARKEKKLKESRIRFGEDYEKWKNRCKELQEGHRRQRERQEEAHRKRLGQHERDLQSWKIKKKEYEAEQSLGNAKVDAFRASYLELNPTAILEYCELVLNSSKYPDFFPGRFGLDYQTETRRLIVEHHLPPPSALPRLQSVSYIKTRKDFREKYVSDAAHRKMYDSLVYQVVLRTVHELFEADTADALETVVFNGIVTSLDESTGSDVTSTIVSLCTTKEEFSTINLARVDPKACFKKLKGVGSAKLHGLAAIAPIASIPRDDERFIESYDVADSLDEGENLAAMDWEDFEHLIRELFERKFSAVGAEVKVTRASRDGGVDAVVMDPDPLRGGKFVIQAKRYTNTVNVAAVRELYGAVQAEGANKGILVTTSDYGADAYSFVRDKPLQLLNGSNLLHMLHEHGYRARIDLKEAKEQLAQEGS